ncbi:MAG: hypothetical protein JST73_11960 [Actinobacteria bacterium]|nr:hypothetical protein [Actinomycetota bacterium]
MTSVDVDVRHTYPAAFELWRRVGPDGVAVLHVLLAAAEPDPEGLTATLSLRAIADRLAPMSKDTVHRRLRVLRTAGVVDVLPATVSTRTTPAYRIHLDPTGTTVTPRASTPTSA